MRTTKHDVFTVAESIAEILNRKNKTNHYEFNYPWGIVKRTEYGGYSVVFYANDCTRATYEKLIAVRDALLEINE
jgi:hypothetical protein